MTDARIIRKYSGRAMYDLHEKRFIYFRDIERLVRENVAFTVINSETGKDITKIVLLKVLLSKENQSS